jgi:hypothetical protein
MTAPPDSRTLYAGCCGYVWPYRAALFAAVIAMIVGGLADAAVVKLTEAAHERALRRAQRRASRSCCRSA